MPYSVTLVAVGIMAQLLLLICTQTVIVTRAFPIASRCSSRGALYGCGQSIHTAPPFPRATGCAASRQRRRSLSSVAARFFLTKSLHAETTSTSKDTTTTTPTEQKSIYRSDDKINNKFMANNTVILKRTQQSKAFRNGNQLVFTRAVLKAPFHLRTGDLVHVTVQGDSASPKSGGGPSQLPDVPIGSQLSVQNSHAQSQILAT
jgi:hypothetical protein